MPASKKQLQSIVATLTVGVLAIAGFLLAVGRSSGSDTPVAGSSKRKADPPVALEPESERTAPDNIQTQPILLLDAVQQLTSAELSPPEGIIDAINNQIIIGDVWQQATSHEAVMSREAVQSVPGAEVTLDQIDWSMGIFFARL